VREPAVRPPIAPCRRPFNDIAQMPVRVEELPALDEDALSRPAGALSAGGAAMISSYARCSQGPSQQSLRRACSRAATQPARRWPTKLPVCRGQDLAEAHRQHKAVVPGIAGLAGRGAAHQGTPVLYYHAQH